MANSKYEYVKIFETYRKLPPYNWIVVKIDGCDFRKFSADHTFEKPNDEKALNLMNACAIAMLDHFPDILFAYGFSDEYSFLLKEKTQFYERRESKILSLFVSYFTSMYVIKWREFFLDRDFKAPPYFDGRVICYPKASIVWDYFSERQTTCHNNNQYDTCFWLLVKSGKTEKEAEECLKGTQPKDKNELLFHQFGVNYDSLPAIFKKGSNVYREKVEVTVKSNATGNPSTRTRSKVVIGHFDIIGSKFWTEHPYILKDPQLLFDSMANGRYGYVKDFETNEKLPPYNWIIVRIDGCHFHKFSADHQFEKPNDENALKLMNTCAVALQEHFPDALFGYGVSDEYSFLLKDKTQLYQRRESKILSLFVSYFTSMYVTKWIEFFPNKDFKRPPYFDGRAVCYPRASIIQDYFSWRQVDCHINNQYNTPFWLLVKSGKTEREAHECLKGTQAKDKIDLLLQQFGVDYDSLMAIFRKGSNVYREKVEETVKSDASGKLVVGHFDIIESDFWREHPYILEE